MTKKHLPKFKSYQEEARFWDSHDMTDYFERNKKIVLDFSGVKKKKESILTVRLQPELKMRLGAVAEGMGIQASTLARMWLVEKLRG
ncbi:MAG: CopG family antitoxin [Patescibacteria group bacterium]